MRVLTVDDQAVFRDAARDVIDATAGFEAVGDVGSGEEAMAAVERLRPELVLLDVRMPGSAGSRRRAGSLRRIPRPWSC